MGSTEDEDEPVRGKRNSKGGKVPKSVEPSKPHRKSRRLDSSTDTATGSSSEASEGSKATTKKRSRKIKVESTDIPTMGMVISSEILVSEVPNIEQKLAFQRSALKSFL